MPRVPKSGVRSASYGYDDLGRLVNATVGGSPRVYDYDDIGNITSLDVPGTGTLSFEYAAGGASPMLTAVGANTVLTDDAGNITDDGQAAYAYSPANHLASRTVGGGTSSYTFTADGRRAGMTSVATTLDVVLAPSGERLARIRDGVERDYVWLGGSLVAYFDGPTGEVVHVITDHIGFPLMAVDSAGATKWDPLHEPYGELVGSFSAAADPGLRYPGQWQDEVDVDGSCVSGGCTMPGPLGGSVSLFENGYRWYRTAWGRYTQSDPIGIVGGHSQFSYAGGNPANFVDALGLKCSSWMPFGSEYTRPISETHYVGYDRHLSSMVTNVPPIKKLPLTPGTSICCRTTRGARYDLTVQLVERNCDCCTSQAELGFAGHADIRDIDTDVYAPDGLCRSINQYGRLIRSKKWLDDFVEWDLWDCYPSLRADGRCSGEIGGT